MSTATLALGGTAKHSRLDRPRIAVWLLVGPCLLYLAAFAIYPLIHSLSLSFTVRALAMTGTTPAVKRQSIRSLGFCIVGRDSADCEPW